MKINELKKVTVVGAGLMGRQIALNNALHGVATTLTDMSTEVLADVKKWQDGYLAGRLEKGRLTQAQVDQAQQLLTLESSLEKAMDQTDLVIEAIKEDVDVKKTFFKSIDPLIRPDTIVATNSSFMQSSLFADSISHPERLANLHYFNPALVMQLVEVIQGEHTSAETVKFLLDFSRHVGKEPIWVKKEIEGFVVNRLLRVLTEEALSLFEGGYASFEEIDVAAEKGLNHPMGPFRLMDLTGVDLQYFARQHMLAETGEKGPAYALLEDMYQKKAWGKKTGYGWYDYRT